MCTQITDIFACHISSYGNIYAFCRPLDKSNFSKTPSNMGRVKTSKKKIQHAEEEEPGPAPVQDNEFIVEKILEKKWWEFCLKLYNDLLITNEITFSGKTGS